MTESDAQRHYRRNFALWVVETAAWMFGTAFMDATTVLPVLLLALSHSPFLASLVISLRYAGQGWPQLFAASLIAGKPYRKVFYTMAVLPGRLLLLWPAGLLLSGVTTPAFTVPAILIAYLAFWISEGLSIVPWTDMVGKTIPSRRRGRLFGTMHVVGGLLGIGAGLMVREILNRHEATFPVGYGVLFTLALAGVLISVVSLALLREPPSPPHEERYSTLALVKDIPNLLRSMPQFRLLVILQGLFGFSVLPAPFYVLYASELIRRAIPGATGDESFGVGLFLAVQTGGMIVGNALWGYISDRCGNRLLLRVLAISHAVVPAWTIVAGLLSPHVPAWGIYLLFAPTFFAWGGLMTGTWLGVTNFLLELAPEHDRPAYIAVNNALNIPAIILPALGGILQPTVGYLPIFAVAATVLIYASYLTRFLHEPREMLTHHHHPPPEAWE